jgi:hypothetical protein
LWGLCGLGWRALDKQVFAAALVSPRVSAMHFNLFHQGGA